MQGAQPRRLSTDHFLGHYHHPSDVNGQHIAARLHTQHEPTHLNWFPESWSVCDVAELASASRPVGVARSLQQLVQPMGAGKTFGTLTGAGGGKFAPMAGGKPAAAAAEGGEGGDGGSARSAGLVSRSDLSSSGLEYFSQSHVNA